jgi:hypothetical protein
LTCADAPTGYLAHQTDRASKQTVAGSSPAGRAQITAGQRLARSIQRLPPRRLPGAASLPSALRDGAPVSVAMKVSAGGQVEVLAGGQAKGWAVTGGPPTRTGGPRPFGPGPRSGIDVSISRRGRGDQVPPGLVSTPPGAGPLVHAAAWTVDRDRWLLGAISHELPRRSRGSRRCLSPGCR